MKTNNLLTLAVMMVSVAACGDRPEQAAAPAAHTEEPAEQQPPAGAAALADADAEESSAPLPLVAPGDYTICDLGATGGHGSHTGVHLNIGDVVTVGQIGMVTNVTLDRKSATSRSDPRLKSKEDLLMAHGEQNTLVTFHSFPHGETGKPDPVEVKHFVSIYRRPATEPVEGCTKDNVITVRFCYQHDAQKWRCSPRDPHYGHVHGQS